MKKLLSVLLAAGMLTLGAGMASANECPLLIKQLNDAIGKTTDAKKAGEAKKLVAEAQKLHESGKHADSIKKADEAAKVLGVSLQHKK